jgi:glycerol-3-phosphate dehydrogenase
VLDFSADSRRPALQRMAEQEFDVLVVGGGITGCGVALDAAFRGLSVALVDRTDFAAGTSGRSSRMVHGGVRYLEQRAFGLVHESLTERRILLRLAPHLVRPVPMYALGPLGKAGLQWRLGLTLYDLLAVGRNIGRHHWQGEDEVRRAVPGLGRPASALVYYECATDDARLTLEVARAARAAGALVANHAEVLALLGAGRVRGTAVVDRLTGERLEIRARATVNATGVWAEQVHGLATDSPFRLSPSKGVHLVLRPGAVDTRVGLVLPSAAGDGRYVFVLPWADRTFVGTTDTRYDGDLADPPVTVDDRAYLLAAVHQAFPSVVDSDVLASWAGLRPLCDTGDGATADLSRRHVLDETVPGLLTIAGGKLTTYRAMAEQLVDRLCASLGGRGPRGAGRRCRTRQVPLGLTGGLAATVERAAAAGARAGLPPGAGRRLVLRYGDDWTEALRLIRADPALAEPVAAGAPVLRVELVLARTREMALTDEDVLVRRTRLATLLGEQGVTTLAAGRPAAGRPAAGAPAAGAPAAEGPGLPGSGSTGDPRPP